MAGWDEEWEASRPSPAAGPARKAGLGAVFAVVLALIALMVVATRWRHWIAPPSPPPADMAIQAGPDDRNSGPFTLCRGPVRIRCVVDGDTIWYDSAKIRIADINAPEITHPQCDDELSLGNRARDRLLGLLNAGAFSITASETRDRDMYGRRLRMITRGGHSLGAVLVREGLAEPWTGHRRDWCH